MSSQSKGYPARSLAMLAMIAIACTFAAVAAAQDQPAPKWELFGGYSFLYPGADVHGQLPRALFPISSRMESNPRGIGASATYNFNRWLGLTLDASTHWGSGETTLIRRIDDAGFSNISLGPKVTFRSSHFSPFLEFLVGDHRLMPDAFHDVDKFGFMGGGGLDVGLSRHVALRLLRADYVFSNYRYGSPAVTRSTDLRGVRLQAGLNFLFGGEPAAPPAPAGLSCNASPNEVNAGEPVTVTATPANFSSKRPVSYTWSTSGGKVTGSASTGTIDSTGLAPGNYTVTAKASDGKKASAQCSSNFTVKEPPKNPPTVSCSANPPTVRSGDSSTITCDCKSPDNRPVTLSNWTASGGKVSGSGSTASLDTSGAAPGNISITATCSDDRGLTAEGSTAVNVENPPPAPQASKLCEFDFSNKAKPARVDNAAKACLDQAADSLNQSPNSRAVVVGEQDANEKSKTLAAQRAVNAKAYLTSGENQKAIDASRIQPVTGSGGEMRDEIWIVPEGANFNEPNTTPVDESKVKPQAGHAAHPSGAAKKKSAKKAPASTP